MKYCPHCGSEIKDPSFKFCGSCGKPFNESNANDHNESYVESVKSITVCPNCGSTRYEPFHKWCEDCENKPLRNKVETAETVDQIEYPKQVCPKCASDRYDSFHQWCEDCSEKSKSSIVSEKTEPYFQSIFIQIQSKLTKTHFLIIATLSICVILVVLFWPSDLKDGIIYIDEGNWDLAIESFSKVEVGSDNYSKAVQGRYMANAYKSYQANKWIEAKQYLEQINMNPLNQFQKAASILKDSTQYHIDMDSIHFIVQRLKYFVQENNNLDSIANILTIVGTKNNYYGGYVSVHYRNGKLITGFSSQVLNEEQSQNRDYQDLLDRRERINSELESQRETQARIKTEGIRWRNFMIDKLFDQRYDDESSETKGVYSGFSMSETSEIVVIASDGEIPNSVTDRISVTLLVKSLGNKGYIKGNEYGYKTNAYAPTYETVSKDLDPNIVNREISKLQKEINTITSSIATFNSKTKSAKEIIINAAIAELNNSTWQ